eukprot:3728484-Rhodomonas_salina.1
MGQVGGSGGEGGRRGSVAAVSTWREAMQVEASRLGTGAGARGVEGSPLAGAEPGPTDSDADAVK